MQGVDFTDEVGRDDVDRIVHAARSQCAQLTPFAITLGPARVDPEALMLPVAPAEPVTQLRSALRDAIAQVWGGAAVPDNAEGFRPHVSLAYSNATGPADTLAARLSAHSPSSVDITVDHVSLIDLNRDQRAYEWTNIATADLAARNA